VGEGLRREDGGIFSVMGAMHPWLRGMSDETMHRSAKITAAFVIAIGAFQFPFMSFVSSGFSEIEGNRILGRSYGGLQIGAYRRLLDRFL
jgi:ABC-type lipoprotein release transport system permease subunit